MAEDYSIVTELPGYKASQEQLARLFQRYHFARQFCKDKEVLEVACGGGIGLGYLAQTAQRVVGGDIDEDVLKFALEHYEGNHKVEIRTFNAQDMPFEDNSFDVAILYEAIYYFPQPEKFIEEAHRILKENGMLLICTANKDWDDFNRSPHSTLYFSVPELHSLLKQKFSHVEILGGFPVTQGGAKNRIISLIKKTAMVLHLIPKTMKGKEKFKRLFFGKLVTLPSEIEEKTAKYIPPEPISSDSPNSQYKVIFAIAYA